MALHFDEARPRTLRVGGFLRTFLGARNYNALTVTNADEAVRRFHAERPAAVLLDVVMPGSRACARLSWWLVVGS